MTAAGRLADVTDYVDTVAVERAVAGRSVGRDLTKAEIRAAVAHMLQWRHSTTDIARRLHLSGATTKRLVAQLQSPR